MAPLDWGNVPSWAAAILTSGSLALGLRDRRNRERDQIERVGIWAEIPKPGVVTVTKSEQRSEGSLAAPVNSRLTVWVRNDSSLPVTVIHAIVSFVYMPTTIHEPSGKFPPVFPVEEDTSVVTLGLVPPGETKKWAEEVELPRGMQALSVTSVNSRVRDNAGRWWDVLDTRSCPHFWINRRNYIVTPA
jgi:hypothetical protein